MIMKAHIPAASLRTIRTAAGETTGTQQDHETTAAEVTTGLARHRAAADGNLRI